MYANCTFLGIFSQFGDDLLRVLRISKIYKTHMCMYIAKNEHNIGYILGEYSMVRNKPLCKNMHNEEIANKFLYVNIYL